MEEEKQFLFYWDSTSPFSDDYMSEFVVDDIVFCFLNQYMLYKKADLFGDENKKKEALASNTPADLNLVDQNVKNFDAYRWYYDSYRFYKKGINAKYTQNKSLRRILVESHPKFILRVPESSRSSIINADPSYLNSNELFESQWTDFLLMELRENIVFKDTGLSRGFNHPANVSMAAIPDLHADQHVNANNEQSCPDEDSTNEQKFQNVVEDALNSKEQKAKPPVESGAESERQNPNPSQNMDSKESHVTVDEKSYAHQSMQSTEDEYGNQENSREEYGQCHDNSSVVSEQQTKNSKTTKEQDDSVVETDSFLFFSGGDCPFSDDYICEFTVDGVTFRFMNQYLFYHKADFFRDDFKMKAALQIQNPKELAATDDGVESYDHWEWVKRRKSIYKKGLKAKFSQSEYLKKKLMESHSKIILHVPNRGNRRRIIEDGPEMAKRTDFQNYFWKEMQLVSIRDIMVSGSTSLAGDSDNSASKNDNSNNGILKQEKNHDTSSNPQTSKKENPGRASKKDPTFLKYKRSNLYFYNDKSGLSNGYQCTIMLNYINFRSMDEYMLYRKAELFQDESVKEKILRGEDYDWDVKNFDRDVWFQKRKELYFEGIQAKFSQNQDLKNELLGTHPKTIVYANSPRVKSDIHYYGLDDWYMNRHHWSEVLQMKLRDELVATTKSGMELPGSDSSETKQNTNATVSKKQSTRSGSRKFRKKDKKEPSQQSVDDDGDRSGDGHSGETDKRKSDHFPEQVKSDEHIVVKVDSSGQRKTEIESVEVENTGANKKKQKEKQVNNNINRTSDNNGSPISTLSQLEKNGSREGDSSTEEVVGNLQSANSKSKTESSETPDAKTSSSEKGKGSKDSINSKSKTWSRRRKPRPEKEKHVNYRNRTLENISKNNRCLLVKDGSELSSDFQCQINIDGVQFSSVTQYIQYCKAEHFQDDGLKAEIMKATDASNGSVGELTVQNFDPEVWYADMAEDVTWSANEAKFTQNEELKQILYDTYPSIIQDMGTQVDTNVTLSRRAQRTHHRLKSILTELRDELMRSENLID